MPQRESKAVVLGEASIRHSAPMRVLFLFVADGEVKAESTAPALKTAGRAAMVALRRLQKKIRDRLSGYALCVQLPVEAEAENEEELIGRAKRAIQAWATDSETLSHQDTPILIELPPQMTGQMGVPREPAVWQTRRMGAEPKEEKRQRRDVRRIEPFGEADLRGEARLEHLLKENEELKRQLKRARLPLEDQLSDFALLREASRIIGVDHKAVLHAIDADRLATYELAGDRKIVNIPECQLLWPEGGYAESGRPAKKKT